MDGRKKLNSLVFSTEVIPAEWHHAGRKERNPEGQKRGEKGKKGR